MSLHDEQKGLDLHEPSRARILNSTGSQLNIGDWVFIAVDENAQGFIPVSRLAASNENLIGLVTNENIAVNATSTVLTLGRLTIDTSAFSVGDQLKIVNTDGVFTLVVSTDPAHDIGVVITSSAIGTVLIDTISIGVSTSSGGATTLNGLNDVTISNLQAGDILVNNAGTFENAQPTDTTLTIDGTSKQITASTTGTTVTIASALGDVDVTTNAPTDDQVLTFDTANSEWIPKNLPTPGATSLANLTDVTLTNLTHNDILEYSQTTDQWENKDIPTGVAETLEQLTDVDVEDHDPNKIILSEVRSALVDIEASSSATNIFGISTTDNLMVIAPDGDTAIDAIHFGIARNRTTDSIDYIITGNELLVQLDFQSSSPTLDDMYGAAFTALQTNFASGSRTIDGTVYRRNGVWSNPASPRYQPSAKAAGSQTFSLQNTAGNTDTGLFTFTIITSTGHVSKSFDLTNVTIEGGNTTAALTDIVNQIALGLSGISEFISTYEATADVDKLTITALNAGAAANAILEFSVRDTGKQNPSGNTRPQTGTINITGGTDEVDNPTVLRWVDNSHSHVITKPTGLFDTTVYFKQGGFAWRDVDFALSGMTDITTNTETSAQMLIKPLNGNNFHYTDALLENLDVDNNSGLRKQGTLLQYSPGNPGWEYVGLANDGSGNFNQTPGTNDFLIFNEFGGFNARWTARKALLTDLNDVSTTNQSRGDILVNTNGTNWAAENATPGEYFVELGNVSGSAGGNIPFSNARHDSHYSTGSDFVDIEVEGAYEIAFSFTKAMTAQNNLEVATEDLQFEVRKNDETGTITSNEWAHLFSSTSNLSAKDSFQIPAGMSGFSSSQAGPIMVDLAVGDRLRVFFSFSNFSAGLNMANGVNGKSWIRIRRMQ